MTVVSSATIAAYLAQRAVRGVAITYTRGGTSLAITAIAGRTDQEQLGYLPGVREGTQLRDFLILASELTLGEPVARDTITEGSRTWRVLDQASQPWRYADPDRTIVRVHCKQVA